MNKNTKKLTIKYLTALFAVSMISGLCVGCNGDNKIVLEYGANYSIPVKYRNNAVVLDSNGIEVETSNNAFIADDINGYTIKYGLFSLNSVKIEVEDTASPEILIDTPNILCGLNEEVKLPVVQAIDNYTVEPKLTVKAFYGDTEKVIEDGKILCDKSGVYEVKYTAKDYFGNTSEKVVYIESFVKNTDEYKVASFETVVGTTQIGALNSLTSEYSSSVKYQNEQGSLKLISKYNHNFNAPSNKFSFKNLFIEDVRDSYGIYFRIKNDGLSPQTLKVNNVLSYNMQPNVWTEIYISNEDFATLYNEQKDINYNGKQDITELVFSFETIEEAAVGYSAHYISNVYYVPKLGISEVDDKMDALIDNDCNIQSRDFEEFCFYKKIYDNFTSYERYTYKTCALIYDPLSYNYRCYEELLVENEAEALKYANKDVEKAYLKYLAQQNSIEYVTNGEAIARAFDLTTITSNLKRITYADSDFAKYQFISTDNTAVISKSDKNCTLVSTNPSINYASEKGCMRVDVGDGWGANMTLQYPLLNSGYSTYGLDINGSNVYSVVNFAVYCEKVEGKVYKLSCNGQIFDLDYGVWNEVSIRLRSQDIKGLQLFFYAGSEQGTDYGSWLSDTTFYMTSLYASSGPSVDTVKAKIDILYAQLHNTSLTEEKLISNENFRYVYDAYLNFDQYKKEQVTNIAKLKDLIFEATLTTPEEMERAKNTLFCFENKIGVYQVDSVNGEVEYSTAKQYGNEAGSLKISMIRSVWECGVELVLPNGYDANKTYKCYLYVEGARGYKINCATSTMDYEDFYLTEGEWVELVFEPGQFHNGDRLLFFADDWKSLLPVNAVIYVSSICEVTL